MAIVNLKSAGLASFDTPQHTAAGSYLAGASDTISKAVIASGATDSIGSTYRFGFISSGASLQDIQLVNDATIAGVWNLGVYCNSQQQLNLGGSVQPWASTVAYVPGNVVLFQGIVYYCTTGNTGSQPPSGNWFTGSTQIAAAGAIPIPNAQVIFGSGISTAAANTTWKSIYTPTIGATTYTAGNVALRVWELLGLAADPDYSFHLVLTCATGPLLVGNIALQWSFVK